MSHQHFYSRVPARVSLFNKRDGFDTFAHSAGLDREFILGELSVMYRDKLEIHNPVRLRRGEIPKVYSQAMMPSGRLVQTVASYLPKDFTGERSAYLAHSLVLSEEEIDGVFCRDGFDVFNPEMFVDDISAFDLTARNATANPAISELKYIPRTLSDVKAVISRYNPEMVKSFIFSLMAAIFDEGREVYLRLPYEDSEASEKSLEFINAIMSILPYSMRQKLSFVSYISTPDAYQGFKLKCVSSDCRAIAPENGVFYDFTTGDVIGQPVEYQRYKAHASFLYTLFEYRKIRDEFHAFVSGIEKKYPELAFNVKTFTDIIFMFWQCSGFYVEESVIINDESMCNFLDVYAAFRDGIAEEHRVRAYRPLGRYLRDQVAIPDGVYTRLSRLYPTECVAAKAVALDVLLGLIHVDVMRERLFAFISRNYAGEISRVKEIINANLCRVFYGGFLQHRILRHFDVYFDREPRETRELIMDKLLLSIRTPEIQEQIVSFLDRHYRAFTFAEKLKLCTTCLEMIPECDGLSCLLVDLINRRIAPDLDIAKIMAAGLSQSLDNSIKAQDHRLTAILINEPGFAEDVAMINILGKGHGLDILISLLCDMPADKRAAKLVRMVGTVPGMTDETYAAILSYFKGRPVRVAPATMYDIISADKAASEILTPAGLVALRDNIIYPSLLHTLLDVFDLQLGNDGIEVLGAYVAENQILAQTAEYGVILSYIRMVELCRGADTQGAFATILGLPEDEDTRKNIAEHLVAHHSETGSDIAECTHTLLVRYLRDGNFGFDQVYSEYARGYEEAHMEKGGIKSKLEAGDRHGASAAAELIIACASEICEASNVLADVVCDEKSGLKRALAEFTRTYGLGAGRFFKKHCEDAYFGIADIAEELIEDRNASIGSVEDAVNLVLRKNNRKEM